MVVRLFFQYKMNCPICLVTSENVTYCIGCNERICLSCISNCALNFEQKDNNYFINHKCFYCRKTNNINIFNYDLNQFKSFIQMIFANSIRKDVLLNKYNNEKEIEKEYYSSFV